MSRIKHLQNQKISRSKHFGYFVATVWLLFATNISGASTKATSGIIGTWKLVSMERQDEQGNWQPRCPSPNGLITYTAQGYMAVGINCMKSEGVNEPTTEPKDMIFYTGKYTVRGTTIVHHVKNSSDPSFYLKDLERTFEFQNKNRLNLLGKGYSGRTVRLTWERTPN